MDVTHVHQIRRVVNNIGVVTLNRATQEVELEQHFVISFHPPLPMRSGAQAAFFLPTDFWKDDVNPRPIHTPAHGSSHGRGTFGYKVKPWA